MISWKFIIISIYIYICVCVCSRRGLRTIWGSCNVPGVVMVPLDAKTIEVDIPRSQTEHSTLINYIQPTYIFQHSPTKSNIIHILPLSRATRNILSYELPVTTRAPFSKCRISKYQPQLRKGQSRIGLDAKRSCQQSRTFVSISNMYLVYQILDRNPQNMLVLRTLDIFWPQITSTYAETCQGSPLLEPAAGAQLLPVFHRFSSFLSPVGTCQNKTILWMWMYLHKIS